LAGLLALLHLLLEFLGEFLELFETRVVAKLLKSLLSLFREFELLEALLELRNLFLESFQAF